MILPYCVVVVVVSFPRTTLLSTDVEARESKWSSNLLMMFIVGSPCPVPMAAPDREEGVMPWIALAAAAILKVSPRPIKTLVSRSSARWRGPK